MDRTKKIYFLFSFVMIIACYALNKSYSMFVQTEEKSIVESVVPALSSSLSLQKIELEPNSEYIIKEEIANTGTLTMNYALISKGNNYTIKMTNDEGNKISGKLEPNKSESVYLYIKNELNTNNVITFDINKNYETISEDLVSNIDIENLYNFENELQYPFSGQPESLKYNILKNYIDSNLFSGTKKFVSGKEIFELYGDNKNIIENTIKLEEISSITAVEKNEKGLYQTEDDYGISYYFRGASSNNYVSFAGKTWRIVRINGDGTIRLILDDVAKNSSGSVIKTTFNTNSNDNAYIGYMYGLSGISSESNYCIIYDSSSNLASNKIDLYNSEELCKSNNGIWVTNAYQATHINVVSSTVKLLLDSWYEDNLINYENYLSDNLFCGDKSLVDKNYDLENNTGLGYGTNQTFYSPVVREYLNSPVLPTLKCDEKSDNNYSRYTVAKSMLPNGKETNGSLKYPVALISADEVVFAGGGPTNSWVNQNYFLFNANITSGWWTLTAGGVLGGDALIFGVDSGYGFYDASSASYTGATIRPVINIKSDVLLDSGDGTINSMYKLKL